ncbi:14525_t:CDS:10 [Dentiscutata erythropus]|uniref:14525_t:CDS:1 n=1 Tax=Dentiscutata erythropus TaxID=1348616 RepID=A0A9N9CTH1_9GLOM|nr:14525_t:CDS:10 [Dentiscutata erythropus]
MIFKSSYPDLKIPQDGVYQYVTSNPNKIPDDKVIYVDGITGKGYTFGEFKHESKKFAAGLQDVLGFKRGDVLAIFSPNQVDYPITVLGTIAAGGKVTTANPKYKAAELFYQLNDSGATVLIVHPEILEVAIEASINAKIPASRVLLFGDKEIKGYKPYRSILIGDREIEPINYTPEEVKSTTAYILYTSGTTGNPKGVEHTHASIVFNQTQLINTECKLGPHSTVMGVTQFCHGYAFTLILHAALIHGATAIIHTNFSVETFCESIQKFKVNHIYAVPPVIHKLVNDPLAQQFNFSSMDTIASAGAPLVYQLEKKFYEMFKIPILQLYGLTETLATMHHPDPTKIIGPGSIGILFPNVKAKILSEDGHELGYNKLGELWIHGPNVMKGYLNNKEATGAVIDKDGFFKTGDIGFQVAPSELESVLLTHDAVSDAAVIGYYSEEESTEIPVAYVIIKEGYEQSQALAKEIQSFVNEKVAQHKKLRGGVLFIDRIPKSEAGKILKGLLREKLKMGLRKND